MLVLSSDWGGGRIVVHRDQKNNIYSIFRVIPYVWIKYMC